MVKYIHTGSFCTDDFDQEMLDWITTKYITHQNNHRVTCNWQCRNLLLKWSPCQDFFWTSDYSIHTGEYEQLTKQQFKERVGMCKKQFTKSDLRTGHLVVLQDGTEYVVMLNSDHKGAVKEERDILIHKIESNWTVLNYYNDDLTQKRGTIDRDIVKVYKQCHPYSFVRDYYDEDKVLLWERTPKETITIGKQTFDKAEFEEATKNLKLVSK